MSDLHSRIVGVGQPMAGDDGVGIHVAREVAGRGLPGIDVSEVAEPSALVPLLEGAGRVVVVDAFLMEGAAPGEVRRLDPDELARGARSLSSHGLGVAQAIALARALSPDAALADVVGIAIAPVRRLGPGLSERVAAAVAPAAELAIALAREERTGA